MGRIAYIFAGQGAQYVGMGQSLSDEFPELVRELEPAVNDLGISLSQVCFEGPEDKLTNTEFAQPGIFWVSWLAKLALESRLPNLDIDATAGLSLGEFTALAAGGGFSFADGLHLVHQRGKAMQDACESTSGGMAAVIGLDTELLQSICREHGVTMANLNCPGQVVISGDRDRIGVVCDAAKEAGAKRALPLTVAGAYHSPLMSPAADSLASVLKDTEIISPAIPVMSNVTGEPHNDPESIRARLVEQVTAPVLWEACVRRMIADGIDTFVELGPGKALSGFMRRIDKSVTVVNVEDAASLEKAIKVLSEMA